MLEHSVLVPELQGTPNSLFLRQLNLFLDCFTNTPLILFSLLLGLLSCTYALNHSNVVVCDGDVMGRPLLSSLVLFVDFDLSHGELFKVVVKRWLGFCMPVCGCSRDGNDARYIEKLSSVLEL